MSYYVSIPLHPYHFANGEIPDFTKLDDAERYKTMAECIDKKPLESFQYCGDSIATITFTVGQDEGEPFDPKKITHVTVHAYDTKTKHSLCYDVDVQDGNIHWEELRQTYAGGLYGPDRGKGVYHARNVVETELAPKGGITIGMVKAADGQKPDPPFVRAACSSILCSDKETEVARIHAELTQVGKRFLHNIDLERVYDKYVASISTSPRKLAAFQFAQLTDIASMKMQEVSCAKYEQYLQSGYDTHQSYSLAMIHATSAALRGELGSVQFTSEDVQVLQNIKDLAIQEAEKDCNITAIQNAENNTAGLPDVKPFVFGAWHISMFHVRDGEHPLERRPTYFSDPEAAQKEAFVNKYTEGRTELGFVISTNDPCALIECTSMADIPKEADAHLYVSISKPCAGQSKLIDVTHMSIEQLKTLAEMAIDNKSITEMQKFIDDTARGDGVVGDDGPIPETDIDIGDDRY